jgi:hypothetical protein
MMYPAPSLEEYVDDPTARPAADDATEVIFTAVGAPPATIEIVVERSAPSSVPSVFPEVASSDQTNTLYVPATRGTNDNVAIAAFFVEPLIVWVADPATNTVLAGTALFA